MNKLSGLIVGVALALTASFASAASDQPSIGGAEMAFAGEHGINAADNTNEFWYAGTSGWASE